MIQANDNPIQLLFIVLKSTVLVAADVMRRIGQTVHLRAGSLFDHGFTRIHTDDMTSIRVIRLIRGEPLSVADFRLSGIRDSVLIASQTGAISSRCESGDLRWLSFFS